MVDICNILNLEAKECPGNIEFNCNINRSRNYYVPKKTHRVPVDGNCLFSSLAYWTAGCSDNCHVMRKCIVESMVNTLKETCRKFKDNKYPNTERNRVDYLNKTNVKSK